MRLNITDENQKDVVLKIVDFAFSRNMTRDAIAINRFLSRVAKITPVLKISDIADGIFDLLMQCTTFNITG